MQQQQDCKADVGVGDALLGGGKSGRMTMLGSLARIEMEAMEGARGGAMTDGPIDWKLQWEKTQAAKRWKG